MKMLTWLLLASLIVPVLSASERIKAEAYKAEKAPDLLTTKWPEPEHFFRKERIAVGVAISDNWLLVSVRTGDADRIAQFLDYGLQLWVDPKGGDERRFGLYFPMGNKVAATTEAPSLEEVLVSERTGVEIEKGHAALQKIGESELQQTSAQSLGFPVSDQNRDGVWFYRVAIPLNEETGLDLPKKGRFTLMLRTPEPDELFDLSVKERAEREQRDNNRRGAFGNEMRGGQFSRGLDGTAFFNLKALDLELKVKVPR
jgi:hypothetical protein